MEEGGAGERVPPLSPRVFSSLPGLRLGCNAGFLQGYSIFPRWIVGHQGEDTKERALGNHTMQTN